jgi:hypothetical protein
VLCARPGWVILGAIKQMAGGLLAVWILDKVGETAAVEPIQQFTAGLGLVLPGWLVLPVAVLFVVISQVKINVTNAYSGSLSWSNFFSRAARPPRPGRLDLPQRRRGARVDGARRVRLPQRGARVLLERGDRLDRRRGRRPHDQQAAAEAQH